MNIRWKIAQSAEIRWWQQYLRHKPKADYLLWKRQYWTDFLIKIGVQPSYSDRILDAGCGPAGIFTIFNENEVVAIDPLLDDYESKLDHFDRQQYPNVHFEHTALENYINNQPFSLVFCLNAINHVADLDHCFDQLVEQTEQGGTLVVSIDAHNYSIFKHIFRLLPGDILHPHQYDLEEYKTMLTDRNITIQNTVLVKKEFLFNYYTIVGQKK